MDAFIVRRGGGGSIPSERVKITLTSADDIDLSGILITITNLDNGAQFLQFAYTGSGKTVRIPSGIRYRVESGTIPNYGVSAPVEYTAEAGGSREITFTLTYGRRYGYRRTKAESEPYARIEYLYDAVGMAPMSVDSSTGEVDYGGWKDFIDELCRPVMLKYDGTVDYELYHDNPEYKLDGTTASDVANTSYGGNAMVEFRKYIWVHRSEDEEYEYVIFADEQLDDTYHAYAHTNESGMINDAFYWGMYEGTYSASKLRSIGTGNPMTGQTRTTEISRAQANGSGWNIIYKSGWDFICDMLTLITKTDNLQAVFGSGVTGGTSYVSTGTKRATAAFSVSSDATKDVKVYHIQGFWGNIAETMNGMILDGANGIKVKMTPPYNTTGEGYIETGYLMVSGYSQGYVDTHSCMAETGYVPKSIAGSETTYMCDGLEANGENVNMAMVGGYYSHGGIAGPRCLNLNRSALNTSAQVGSRLSYLKP